MIIIILDASGPLVGLFSFFHFFFFFLLVVIDPFSFSFFLVLKNINFNDEAGKVVDKESA